MKPNFKGTQKYVILAIWKDGTHSIFLGCCGAREGETHFWLPVEEDRNTYKIKYKHIFITKESNIEKVRDMAFDSMFEEGGGYNREFLKDIIVIKV